MKLRRSSALATVFATTLAVTLIVGSAVDLEDGTLFNRDVAFAGIIVAPPTPTRPSSAPPTRTPTRTLIDDLAPNPTARPTSTREAPDDFAPNPTARPSATEEVPNPTRTPTPTPIGRTTPSATLPGVATQPTSGLPVQGDIFSPTPTPPVFQGPPTPITPVAPVPKTTLTIPNVPTGDLRPMRIEVLQTVHASLVPGGPYVPLLANKSSLVRVWVLMLGAEPAGAPWPTRVELRAFRDGQELTGCAQSTADVEKEIYEDVTLQNYESVMSGNLSRTFNFNLPPNCYWLDEGVVELRAKVYGFECTACLDNNTIETSFTFLKQRPMRLRFHLLTYQGTPTEFSYEGLVPFLTAWPFAQYDLKISPTNIDVPEEFDLNPDLFKEGDFDGTWWTNYGALLSYLQDCCTSGDVDLEIGVLPQSIVGCWGYGGSGWALTGIGCGGTYSHEGGHGFGLTHSSTSHGECAGGGCDENWPWLHGRMDGYGWTPLRPSKLMLPDIPGGHSHDAMSYGGCAEGAPDYGDSHTAYCGTWLSTLNYARLGQRLWCFDPQSNVGEDWVFGIPFSASLCYARPWPLGGPFFQLLINPIEDLLGSQRQAETTVHAASLQDPATPYTGGALRISGSIEPNGEVRLRPFYIEDRAQAAADPSTLRTATGTHRVELQNAAGEVLVTGRFDPKLLHGHTPIRRYVFEGVVPWDPGTTRIVLYRGDQIVAERLVSESAPRVALLSPVGGEVFAAAGPLVVSWQGQDPDGDALSYWLQYSPDAGATWTTVFKGLTGSTHSLDLDRLPATSTARVRVLASDGVRTAVAESPLFAVTGGAGVPSFSLTDLMPRERQD